MSIDFELKKDILEKLYSEYYFFFQITLKFPKDFAPENTAQLQC